MSLDRQPSLTGTLVELRPLLEEDWDALFAVASDSEIWAMHPMHDRWREPVFRDFFNDALAKGGALAVIDRSTGRIVGSSRFERYDSADGGSVEIGWTFLAREFWGKGYNREMKRLMLTHALQAVQRVDFRVGDANTRSRRALEKIGARLSPDRVEKPLVPGVGIVLHLYYEIDRENFASGPLSA
ncbi:GNAT family N-acetyltransferase [Aurantiacibacter sp. D1-12]|uniref:GNAT family N-acetyltransferase n=1 Tax=Aurantiacibacter sp. D1-12 TaxID=2993658 RepID=UPI00237C54D6|nr:GNAT family N-acetyltransferase [Aurantiacibacter sp. D1-12]MDE1467613.1 GNAT family N-acetyltransferase [Aurantiacibacter sp. D1-12]